MRSDSVSDDVHPEGVYRNPSERARGEGVSTAAASIALGKLKEREGGWL